ncbi:TetR/AcrR family transcriptional regulator [Rhodococcoides corynebacterioides]|uniref:TetR/AcrR family transcriptional regulator n=1 Tax=Rhodococcoides corynebacterioides TaxID=53972 RepID=A0ABS7NYM1_9NOCA|nr:TetR/AcrR family transcriptional regulator [Rhodococcus corynebacterioides]MBY6365234.1 TetR/AcrR family transcriptional regulator [Rhodococcus corynebacterioides]MBY6406646.1 TetR/AcrR family transcriptional regulator [Rhodococcus corynebacterioides]
MAVDRLERRKARTRAALVSAAQTFLAEGRLTAPILEITQAADVGMGSFYNHFSSKEELFEAAVDEALEALGAYLDTLTVGMADPVEKFTQSFRLTGRLFRADPSLSRVFVNSAAAQAITTERGLAPRSLRDIEEAVRSGRFDVEDTELALALVAGTLVALGRVLLDRPERNADEAVDRTAMRVLRALGVSTDEAAELVARPLPDTDHVSAATVLTATS